jgi:hypothetical protein
MVIDAPKVESPEKRVVYTLSAPASEGKADLLTPLVHKRMVEPDARTPKTAASGRRQQSIEWRVMREAVVW